MYEYCFFLYHSASKRSLEHTTVKVSRKKYYEVNFKSNKNKKLEIHAKYYDMLSNTCKYL